MVLNSVRRRACGLIGAMYIISIVANSVWMMLMLRHERKQQLQQPRDYYSMTAGVFASQCSGGRCSVSSSSGSCASGSCAAPEYAAPGGTQGSGSYAWDAFGPPWRLTQGGTLIGTLYANGSFIGPMGEAVTCPAGWYPSGFDTTKLAPKVGGDKVSGDKVGVPPASATSPNGVVPPTQPEKTGDATKPLFGVATKELDTSLQTKTSHYFTTDSEGKVRDITRGDAFYSVGNPQLNSFYKGYNLAIIGVDAQARSEMAAAARQSFPAGTNVTIDEYDPKKPADLWHVQGDWNHALAERPSLAQGGAVAYFTNGPQEDKLQREVMAWSPDEVVRFAKTITTSIRPQNGIPNHDPNKAKVDQPLFGMSGWPLTQYQTFVSVIILAGCVLLFTPKPPAIEAQ